MAVRVRQNQRKGTPIRARDAAAVGQSLNALTQRLRAPRDLTGGQTDDPDRQKERGPAGPEVEDADQAPVFPAGEWLGIAGTTETVRLESESDPAVFVDQKQFRKITMLTPDGQLVTFDLNLLFSL